MTYEMNDFEISISTLKDWNYSCTDRCALCCLCQPEILPEEAKFFRRNHSQYLVRKSQPHKHLALSLKKERGSCSLLQDRRCSVYENRPHFCRMFPFHFHVGERLSAELNLSCRMVWDRGGIPAVDEAMRLVDENTWRITETLKQSRQVYDEFRSNCETAGVWAEPEDLRAQLRAHLHRFADLSFLGQLMLMSYDDPELDLQSIDDKDYEYDVEEMEEAAREAALTSLDSSDPINVPVYCAPDWSWNIYMSTSNGVEWKLLDDEGDFHHRGFVNVEQVGLLPLTPDGEEELLRYISVLNERDSIMGNAYHLVDMYGYIDHLSNVYFGMLAVTVIDLLWRASLLSHFHGISMDRRGMREAIIFYDMDRLDAPTIGAFI